INNVFRKFSAFHDETGRLNVDGMNIISNDGSNKLNRSRKARVSYKVQRTINASLNAATSTRAVSSNPNFVTRQKIEIIDLVIGKILTSRLSLSKHLAHNLGNLLLLGKIGVFHNRRNASSRLLLLISKHLILCIYLVFRILA